MGLDFDPEPGLADNGDLELDRHDLLEASGQAVKEAGTALAIFIDELQYVEEEQLAAMVSAERRYLRAMAELGPGPHRSGAIADVLNREVTALGPTRSQLIAKGMIWSPGHGDTAFTVPLFDEFMCMIMPGDEWKAAQ